MGADWTMAAIVGSAGLKPVLAALEAGSTVALANKEALVCAGPLVKQAAARGGGRSLALRAAFAPLGQGVRGGN